MHIPKPETATNIIAGVLVGYGFVSFICFLAIDQSWVSAAPHHPNEALGLIYSHDEHGSYTYFSKFQATACWLMFSTSIPLAFVGGLIAPKKNVSGTVRWYGARFTWDNHDPEGLIKRAAIASAIAAPLFLFFVGPTIVRGLNAIGFVVNIG
jgi:hypothetical protein